jgi:hypothetical protein
MSSREFKDKMRALEDGNAFECPHCLDIITYEEVGLEDNRQTSIGREIVITTSLGIVLFKGSTILSDKEILELFDKNKYGIFITDNAKTIRLDLKKEVGL